MTEFAPKEVEFCMGCETDLCLDCAVTNLRDSEAGKTLKDMPPRYSMWHWEDLDRFKHFMGPDVDMFEHGIHQAVNVSIPMVEQQNMAFARRSFTRDEAKLLFLTHVFHDVQESVVGDIPLPDKTRESDTRELYLNESIVRGILGSDPDDQLPRNVRNLMGDLDGQTFLGRAFKAGEYCGYFLTGIRAWLLKDNEALTAPERAKCEAMGRIVTLSTIPKLESYDELVLPDYLLRANAHSLAEMRGHTKPLRLF